MASDALAHPSDDDSELLTASEASELIGLPRPQIRLYTNAPGRIRTCDLRIRSSRLGGRFGSVEPDLGRLGAAGSGNICRVGERFGTRFATETTEHCAARRLGRLHKGLNATTLDNVRDAVREAQTPLTASEVGRRCGLSRVTARRYLEHLAAEGIVTLSMRYGRTGAAGPPLRLAGVRPLLSPRPAAARRARA